MTILSGIPVLHCQHIEDTAAFYQQVFQFVIVKKRENDAGLQWVHLMHGDTTLMLSKIALSDQDLRQSRNISLYFFVNEIKELHHFVKVKYQNVSEVNTTDYQMQEFDLNDPEGNNITVGMTAKLKQPAEQSQRRSD